MSRAYFLGDYQGLVANSNGFIPFYVKTNCDAPYPSSNPLWSPRVGFNYDITGDGATRASAW